MIYIDGIIYSLQKQGGISVYFNNLISSLKKSNMLFQVDLLENDFKYTDLKIDKKLVHFRKKKFFERLRYCNVPNATKVFHSSYYRLPHSQKVPSITTVHDFIHEKFLNTAKSKIFSLVKKKAVLSSDRIICVSNKTRDDLLYFIPEAKSKKIVVIPNGVSASFVERKTEKPETPFILYVGTGAKYKNIDITLKSLEFLSDIKLYWVGASKKDKIVVKEEYSNISSNVVFLDKVNEDKLVNLYNTCLCLIYISEYEGFGIPFYEAIKCRCPVIVYKYNPVFQEFHNDVFVLEYLDPNLLSKLILKSTSINKHLFTQKTFEKIKNYSWENTHIQTMNLYKEFY
jgi:mannosyltransferase